MTDPFALFDQWFAEARAGRAQRSRSHDPCDRRCRPAGRRRGWCCSRATARTASSSTPTSRAPRATSSPPTRRQRCSSTGSRCAARSASKARVERVPDAEADAYFATRGRDSQLGAWASDQSRPLDAARPSNSDSKRSKRRFDGQDVPRPPHWGGYRRGPGPDRILDRSPAPAARTPAVHPRRRLAGREGLLYP